MLTKQHILTWLAEWRDEQEASSNRYHVYSKAYKSLLAAPFGGSSDKHVKVIIEDLRGVKYIGDKIRKRIETRANEENLISDRSEWSPERSSQKHSGGALGGASPPKRTRTTAIKRSETVIYSSNISTTLKNDLPPLHQLQRVNTAPIPSLPADMNSVVNLGLTPEELEFNMFSMGASDMMVNPDVFVDEARSSSPLAPVYNTTQLPTKPKTKSKARPKAKPTSRLSNPVPPPPVFSSADSSLVLNESPLLPTPTRSSSTARTTPAPTAMPQIPSMISLRSCDYSIHLVLDNREVQDQKHRDTIFNDLVQLGIDVIRMSLNLGDVVFVARRKEDGQLFVLDCILERKRLDDLVGSIQDGRFHEQKFRLSRCGLSHIVYLVEEYNPARYEDFFLTGINTSLSQTIVIDGFEVQETRELKFTIDYFANLYWSVVEKYANKTLYILPSQSLKRNSFTSLLSYTRSSNPKRCEAEQYVIPYDSFQSLNSKTGSMTLDECWARMLLSIRGMSAEKVAFVIGDGSGYETPKRLYKAFKRDEDRERREMGRGTDSGAGKRKTKIKGARELLCELGGSGRSKIGAALSGHVYDLLMGDY